MRSSYLVASDIEIAPAAALCTLDRCARGAEAKRAFADCDCQKDGARYVFGVSVAKQHLTLAPMGDGVLDAFRPRLTGYEVNKKTLRVPSDWSVDGALLCDMVTASRGR